MIKEATYTASEVLDMLEAIRNYAASRKEQYDNEGETWGWDSVHSMMKHSECIEGSAALARVIGYMDVTIEGVREDVAL